MTTNTGPERAPRCLGIFGFLFGHKYLKGAGDYVLERDNCWRCGYKRGA